VPGEPFGGTIVIATQDPGAAGEVDAPTIRNVLPFLTQQMNSAWQDVREPMCGELKEFLGRGDLIAHGITLYDIDCRLSKSGPILVDDDQAADGSAIDLTYRLERSLIIATSTTPTVLGKEFDPRVSIDFDIEVGLHIGIPNLNRPLHIDVTTARIINPHLDSQNLPADILKIANDISDWFGGPNFIDKAVAMITKRDLGAQLNAAVQPVNDALATYAQQGFGFLGGMLKRLGANPGGLQGQALGDHPDGSPELVLMLRSATGDGRISGTIRWGADQGTPLIAGFGHAVVGGGPIPLPVGSPICNAFDFEAAVVTDDPDHVFTESHVAIPLRLAACDHHIDGDHHQLTFSLANLPLDMPIQLAAKARSDVTWDGAAAGMLKLLEPAGWSGNITIHPPLNVAGEFGSAAGLQNMSSVHAAGLAPGEEVELNPQPIPPGRLEKLIQQRSPGEAVELNPQPIPPGHAERVFDAARSGALGGAQQVPMDPGRFAGPVAEAGQTFVRPDRDNPAGSGEVAGIDFELHLTSPIK
jgi:hypothetical protein